MTLRNLLPYFLFISIPFSAYTQNINIDVTHYRFQLELSDTSDMINGKATIFFKTLEKGSSIVVDFAKYDKGKGMNILGIYVGERDDNRLAFSRDGEQVQIKLPESLNAGVEQQVSILYWGVPRDGLIISKNKYGHRTFFADNWPNRGHNWIPCVDNPADKATVEFIVTAPEHYQVVSNGVQLEETNINTTQKKTHWKEEVPVATKVMVIGVADFAVNLAGTVNGCLPVYSWVYPEQREKGFYDYGLALEILPFYIKNVGPYGYKKLANVQSKTTFGGLENANTIFYHENSITGDRNAETLMAHEIAHQWFGNMVTEKSFAHLWLSEGFATYLSILYMENKYGHDTLNYMLAEDRAEVIDFISTNHNPVIDSSTNYMKLLNANNYQKGGWILHMLRRQLGDSVFYRCLKTFYSAYAGKNADTKDLQLIFEKVSGKSLSVFFKQWLYTPGIPSIDVKWKYNAAKKTVTINVSQIQSSVFTFPLTVQLNNATGKEFLKTVDISGKVFSFTMPVREKPVELILDPAMALLFEGTVSEKE